ncbi:MAG: hypothetical protein GX535_07230 [Xanthomonadaceae bacterium]|nr:hypothetical protein [Xanthomonadaceae bacterium]
MNENVLSRPRADEARGSHERWQEWQHEVLSVINSDFHYVLDIVEWNDIDWDAWRPLFEQGCSPKDAVRSAFGQVA